MSPEAEDMAELLLANLTQAVERLDDISAALVGVPAEIADELSERLQPTPEDPA